MNKHAVVLIWPLMTKPAQKEEEIKLVEAGYTHKDELQVGQYKVWRCT